MYSIRSKYRPCVARKQRAKNPDSRKNPDFLFFLKKWKTMQRLYLDSEHAQIFREDSSR